MTQFEFRAHIRTLGEFTNIQCQTLYKRYLDGALTLEQIAINAPSGSTNVAFNSVDVSKPVILKPTFSRAYKRMPAKDYTVLACVRQIRYAIEEDNILLLFKESSFITTRSVMEAYGYQRQVVRAAIKRLISQDALMNRHAKAGKGFIYFYVLKPFHKGLETLVQVREE